MGRVKRVYVDHLTVGMRLADGATVTEVKADNGDFVVDLDDGCRLVGPPLMQFDVRSE